MKTEKQGVNKSNWNILIVLDACRYDTFKKYYNRYFSGKLKKRKSLGSGTVEWLYKTFPKEYDYTYISANPHINSKGLSLGETTTEKNVDSDWNSKKTFSEVIDVWDTDWSEEVNTVLPEDLNRVAEKYLDRNKVIIHYMQPHLPYISKEARNNLKGITRFKEGLDSASLKKNITDLFYFFGKPLWNRLSKNKKTKIKRLMKINRENLFERMARNNRLDEIKKYYNQNLEIVLESVAELIKKIPENKKVIITSDHGEAFGEQNTYGHPIETHIPTLVEVPWFEVEGVKKTGKE